MDFFQKWLRNHPQFLLHFLIHIDVLRLRLHSNENDGICIVLCLFYASVYTETNRILIELYGNENGVQSVSF